MPSETDPFPIGDVSPSNRRDGEFTGPFFSDWGDPNRNHGQLVMLRMEAVHGSLPQSSIILRKSVESYSTEKHVSAHRWIPNKDR